MTEDAPHHTQRMRVQWHADEVSVQHPPGRRPEPPQGKDGKVGAQQRDRRRRSGRNIRPHSILSSGRLVRLRKEVTEADGEDGYTKRGKDTTGLPEEISRSAQNYTKLNGTEITYSSHRRGVYIRVRSPQMMLLNPRQNWPFLRIGTRTSCIS